MLRTLGSLGFGGSADHNVIDSPAVAIKMQYSYKSIEQDKTELGYADHLQVRLYPVKVLRR